MENEGIDKERGSEEAVQATSTVPNSVMTEGEGLGGSGRLGGVVF